MFICLRTKDLMASKEKKEKIARNTENPVPLSCSEMKSAHNKRKQN